MIELMVSITSETSGSSAPFAAEVHLGVTGCRYSISSLLSVCVRKLSSSELSYDLLNLVQHNFCFFFRCRTQDCSTTSLKQPLLTSASCSDTVVQYHPTGGAPRCTSIHHHPCIHRGTVVLTLQDELRHHTHEEGIRWCGGE